MSLRNLAMLTLVSRLEAKEALGGSPGRVVPAFMLICDNY